MQDKSVDVNTNVIEEKFEEDGLSIPQNEDLCNELLYFADTFKKSVGRMIGMDLFVD